MRREVAFRNDDPGRPFHAFRHGDGHVTLSLGESITACAITLTVEQSAALADVLTGRRES